MDRWDGIGFLGLALIVTGVGFIHWQTAAIVGGCGLLAVYFLRERAHAAQSAARR